VRQVPGRVLLLGAAAAVVVPGGAAWSYRAAEALLWTPAILSVIGTIAVMPADRSRARVSELIAGGCAAVSSITTVAILVVAGPLDVRSMSAGAATLGEALGLVALIVIAVRVGGRSGGLVIAALGALAMGTMNFRFEGLATTYERLMGTLLWGVAGLGAAAGGRHLRAQDERRARALVDAKRTQRLVVARDLHDFVAHDLSAALAQAQAGQFLGVDDDRVTGVFRSIEDSAQRALRSMDRTLRMLRELESDMPGVERSAVSPPDLSELAALVERFEASGSWDVHLEVDPELERPDPRWLPAEVSTTLYRVAVEALTNVRRHARRASAVRVRAVRRALHDGTTSVELSVVDDAPRAPASRGASKRGGSGLPALADRLEALGGQLHAGPEGTCGWSVRAVVPLHTRGALS
jgi:signal transduction histidine kinase